MDFDQSKGFTVKFSGGSDHDQCIKTRPLTGTASELFVSVEPVAPYRERLFDHFSRSIFIRSGIRSKTLAEFRVGVTGRPFHGQNRWERKAALAALAAPIEYEE